MDATILTTALFAGYIVYRAGLPPMVGFLLAGLALSAMGVSSTPLLKTGADVGVTLLLFTIGLKLNVRHLLRPEVWGAGLLHMGVTVAIFGCVIFGLGFTGMRYFTQMTTGTVLVLAFALSFSSTVFAVKILEEGGRMSSLNGRTAIGVLIIQDIVAVIYLTFSTGQLPSAWALVVIALLPMAKNVFTRTLHRVGHGELMVLLGLFMALIAGARVFEAVHLKPGLGALILGMLMAPHPRAKEVADSLLSIKDVLLVGFFLDIGLGGLPGAAGLVAAAVLVVLLPLKMIIYFIIFTRFTLKARTSFMTTVNLANYSEFGLIVGVLAASQGHLDKSWLVVIGIALSTTFIIASSLNKSADPVFERFSDLLTRFQTRRRHPEEAPLAPPAQRVVVVGMGRIGVGAYDWFTEQVGDSVLGVDFDQEKVDRLAAEGRRVLRADVTDADFWRRMPAPAQTVELVVLALANVDAMRFVVARMKAGGYTAKIAAVARHDDEVAALGEAGVDTAFNVFAEAGAGLAAHTCGHLEGMAVCDRPPG